MITYNNKDILKSFIGNNRVVKKYLNNKVVYGIPDFAQYYNIQGYNNYEVIGNPTIIDGVVTGLSGQDYIKFQALPSSFQELEINLRYVLNQRPTNWRLLFGPVPSTTPRIMFIDNRYRLEFLSSGTLTYMQQWGIPPETDVVCNYNVKITSDKIAVKYTNLNNGTIKTDSFEGVVDVNTFFEQAFAFGYSSSFESLDLNETYIKVNGKYWFNGNSNYKELLDYNPNVYLQSVGNAYINTMVPSNSISTYKIDYRIIDSTVLNIICGADSGFRNNADDFMGVANNGLYWYYGTGDSAYYRLLHVSSNKYLQKNRLEVNFNSTSANASIYNNDEQIGTYTTSIQEISSNNIYLFGLNRNGTLIKSGNLKIYSAQYYGNNINKHLVPVPEELQIGSYKVPSNGMFDIVEQKFYENKGSGEFIWGVDL